MMQGYCRHMLILGLKLDQDQIHAMFATQE